MTPSSPSPLAGEGRREGSHAHTLARPGSSAPLSQPPPARGESFYLRRLAPVAVIPLFALAPLLFHITQTDYLLFPTTRIIAYAIAAVALDFVLGYGGLVSFGHAAFIGIGAYTLGIAAVNDIIDAAITLPLAAITGAAFALITGAIALRTSGVYFIMITLAFGQMAFFTAGSLAQYGGDDGLTLPGHSTLFGTAVLENRLGLYYVALAVLAVVLLGLGQIVRSRFGRVLRGCRDARERMRALGFTPYPYRLLAYTISGALAGVAGALLAELTQFASPAYMAWPRSGDLLVAVILGGAGTLWGPVLGTLGYLALSDWLADWTEHWRIVLGPLLVMAVLLRGWRARR